MAGVANCGYGQTMQSSISLQSMASGYEDSMSIKLGFCKAPQYIVTVEKKKKKVLFLLSNGRPRLRHRFSSSSLSPMVVFYSAPSSAFHLEEELVDHPSLASTPNPIVLDAQARICTGPRKTKPLSEAQAFQVLKTIAASGLLPVADVKSLTHYGEPYDGNSRFFRSTLFVAAVTACYGEACLIHGVKNMPPKVKLLFRSQDDAKCNKIMHLPGLSYYLADEISTWVLMRCHIYEKGRKTLLWSEKMQTALFI